MRYFRQFALVVMVMAMVQGAPAARERGRRKPKEPEVSLLDQLIKECKLTEKQQAAVKAKVKVRDDALAAWDKANAEKVQAAKDAVKDARSRQDDEARKKASGELRALQTARKESAAEATAAVMTVLTPQQKAAWGAYQLYQSTITRYRRAELTQEQLAKIKAACAEVSKELAEIGDDHAKPEKAKRDIARKLQWGINVFILTPEQRETMAKRPGRRGGKAKDKPAA